MRKTHSNRFLFSAYANSLSAVLHQPVKSFFSDGASAALSTIGGHHTHTKRAISFQVESAEVMTADRVTSTVLGELRGDHYISLATCTVEKLNILDIVTADSVVSRVNATYPVTDSERPRSEESDMHKSVFFFAGSHFSNLRVNGKLIDCAPDPILNGEDGIRVGIKESQSSSLFTNCPDIYIPQFGTVHLGGIDKYSSKVILTMIRVEFGCALSGSASAATSSTNGKDA